MNLTQNTVVDGFGAFPKGMNAGVAPQLLPKDQASMAVNCTFRGDFLTHRPPYRRLPIDYTLDFDGTGLFQGVSYYQPDYGPESLVASIGGHLFQFFPSVDGCDVVKLTNDATSKDPYTAQHWLWQSERWLIDQDGSTIPRIFDGDKAYFAAEQKVLGVVTENVGVPAPGEIVLVTLQDPFPGQLYTRVNLSASNGGTPPLYTGLGVFEVYPNASGQSQVTLSLPVVFTGTKPTFVDGTQIQIANPPYTITEADAKWLVHGVNSVSKVTFTLAFEYPGKVGDWIMFKPEGNFKSTPTSGKRGKVLSVGKTADGAPTVTLDCYGGTPGTTIYAGAEIHPNINYPYAAPTFSTIGKLIGQAAVPGLASITPAYTGIAQQVWINNSPYWISAGLAAAGNTIGLLSISGTQGVANITVGSILQSIPQIPPGRMGAYVLGRNWMALADGVSFIATDMVGDSSGSQAMRYRDAVLQVSENTLLAGGGAFQVPGACGDIRFMADLATLDASLGQGAVQIGTPNKVFSCDAPYLTSVDRLNWQSLTNPIVTESLVGKGGSGQRSAVVVNGDLFMRSEDGIRSLILARREFATWGNTPVSAEIGPVLSADDFSLLKYCSGIEFDNRLLMTTGLTQDTPGVYGTKSAAMNFDPVSSLRGKMPTIYDGVWQDLNVLQYVKGLFAGVERAFAFVWNAEAAVIELWELLPSTSTQDQRPLDPSQYLDNGTDRITWSAETPILLDTVNGKEHDSLCRLLDGELYISDIEGVLDLKVFFRPDYDQEWHLWKQWTVKDGMNYAPRMGLGSPPGDMDLVGKRPWREGYAFQLKIVITGHCTLMGARVSASLLPTPTFAPAVNERAKYPNSRGLFVPGPKNPVGVGALGAGGDPMTGAGGEPIEMS